jgi:MFS family permease
MAAIALPFYGIYAKNMLNAPEGMVEIYVATYTGAQLLFNLPWGRVSDRRGNRLVMRLSSLGSGLAVLLALGLVGLVEFLRPQGAWLPYLALPLFFLDGAVRPARMLTGNNFLLELVPDDNRPLCLGLSNTLTGVVTLASGFGGLVVDFFGFIGLFLLALALYLFVFVLASGLPEPRNALG